MKEQVPGRAFTRNMLPKVSRSFALTIPQLPANLATVVGNAYLLCRIADTIEDEPGIPATEKIELHRLLPDTIDDPRQAERLVRQARPLLTAATPDAEQRLLGGLPVVTAQTRTFDPQDRTAIVRCLRTMCFGMQQYEERAGDGLTDLNDLGRYCYYVAGVVGEMLTELFCHHDARLAQHRAAMLRLAPSFGQGLQMTNILKDVWEDFAEGRCWLPRSEFESAGADLDRLDCAGQRARVTAVIDRLVRIAHGHLQDALEYTLYIPRRQAGMRRFCFWSVGLAALTLQRIRANPGYRDGSEVKVSRRQLAEVIATSYLAGPSNHALRLLFQHWSAGLGNEQARVQHAVRMEGA